MNLLSIQIQGIDNGYIVTRSGTGQQKQHPITGEISMPNPPLAYHQKDLAGVIACVKELWPKDATTFSLVQDTEQE